MRGALLAALLLGAGAAVLLVLREPAPAVVLAAAAVSLPVLGGREAQGATDGSMETVAALVAGLRLRGHGVHLVGEPGAGRVFVAASPESRAVPEPGDEVVLRGTPTGIGVVVPAPGAPLEATWAQVASLPRGQGLEEAADQVGRALPALGLGRDVRVESAPGRLRLRYRPRGEACRRSREAAPWHVQGGCPTCSFAALVAARALGRPVRFGDCFEEDGRVVLDLEVL